MTANRAPSKGRLGGGLIAAAIGVNPYRSVFEAALKVRGETPDDAEANEDIDRGNFLEPALRNWYKKKSGAMTVLVAGTESDPDLPWASYSADGIASFPTEGEGHRVLEIKAPGDESGLRYGSEDTDQVPQEVLVQGVWGVRLQYKLRGIERCDFAAFIDNRLQLFKYVRDVALEREVFDRAKFFMDNYVFGDKTPTISGTRADTSWLKQKFPSNNKPALTWAETTDAQRLLLKRYFSSYVAQDAATKELTEWENALKLELGDRAGFDLAGSDMPAKRLDWKQNKDGEKTDWKALAEVLGAKPEQVQQFTKPTTGARPFVPRFPRSK